MQPRGRRNPIRGRDGGAELDRSPPRAVASTRCWRSDQVSAMGIDRSETQAEHLRWQAGWCRKLGSGLYGSLLERAADDAVTGGPVARALEEGDASQRSMLALRLMGAVHRLVLQGDAPELARFYPSVGGRADEEGAWR